MQKKFILILVLTALVCGAKAQVQYSIGPGVGFNYTMHSVTEDSEIFNGFGALVTSQLDMQFSRHFGLILWFDFFSDMSVNANENNVQEELIFNYIHISPTLKYCLPGFPLYFFGGPGIGFNTKGAYKIKYQGSSGEEDLPGIQTRFDFRLGAGYEFFLTKKLTLTPFAGFNIGLNSVIENTEWQINAFQAGIVLRYNLF